MSQQENQYPVLPAEFSGARLLKITQEQFDELETIYGQDQLAERAYEFVQSLA